MIIWIASYPRSGNTLLKTVMKQCLGLGTYDPWLTIDLDNVGEIIGEKKMDQPWDQIYKEASHSSELLLVKTHLLPTDSFPAIYIIRPGQAACCSYFHYHQKFHPEAKKTLVDVIAGDDIYGDWSTHYEAWNTAPQGPRLLLHFKDLVSPSQEILQKIATFLNYRGEIKPWQNPMEKLQALQPGFFREGKTTWSPPPEWDSFCDSLFWGLHSEVMQKLDYPVTIPRSETYLEDIKKIASFLKEKSVQKQHLQKVCDERLTVINSLDTAHKEYVLKNQPCEFDEKSKKPEPLVKKWIDFLANKK